MNLIKGVQEEFRQCGRQARQTIVRIAPSSNSRFLDCSVWRERHGDSLSVDEAGTDENSAHEWPPLNPTKHTLSTSVVISKTLHFVDRYKDCAVFSVADWKCQYQDQSGYFGFRDGKYWKDPLESDLKYVSKLEYYLINCEWNFSDPSLFQGVVGCVGGWLVGP